MAQEQLPDWIKPSETKSQSITQEDKLPDWIKPIGTTEQPKKESKSLIGRGLDWLFTTPEPAKKFYAGAKNKYESYAEPLQKQYGESAMDLSTLNPWAQPQPSSAGIDIMKSMTTPGDIAMMIGTGGVGNIAKATRGLSKLASGALAARGASRAYSAENLPEFGAGVLETGMGALGFKYPVTFGSEARTNSKIPNITEDIPNIKSTYEATPEGVAQPYGTQKVTKPKAAPKLPPDLKGAKPRFNIGYSSYVPEFESDLDKALYIIAQTKRSKRDADYLKFVIDTTGLNAAQARKLGATVRTRIKSAVAGEEPGVVKIGQIHKLADEVVVSPEPKLDIPETEPALASEVRETTALEPEILDIEPSLKQRVESGERVPDYTQVAENGNIWVDNLYGPGAGGYADKNTIAFIGNTAKRRGAIPEVSATTSKPKFKLNLDGTYTPIEPKPVPEFVRKAQDRFAAKPKTAPKVASKVVSEPLTPEITTYLKGIRSGEIPKGTKFDDWRTANSETLEPKQSFAERLLREEEGAYRPGFVGRALKEAKENKAITRLREDVINTLIQGGRLDLNAIRERATAAGISKQKFNKVVDNIISSGETQQVAEKIRAQSPTDSAVGKLFDAIIEAKPLREQQEKIYSAERGKRFSAFLKVKATGMKGAKQSLSKLKGEHTKVSAPQMQLSQEDLNSLFTAIKRARNITPGEMAHGFEALFKLINGGHVPQRNELMTLDRVFGAGFGDRIVELHGGLGATGIQLAKSANTMKAMMASIDMSAPLRQGLPLIHRKEYWSAFFDMFKSAASQKHFNDLQKAIEERPKFLLGREAGLHQSDVGSLLTGEEAYLNSYLHDISVGANKLSGDENVALKAIGKVLNIGLSPFKASERAYIGFLNKLRADTFDNMIDQAIALGHNEEEVAGGIARFINTATGRGSLGSLEKNAVELNTLLFSPRLIASRIQMFTNPKLYKDLPEGMRKEGIKSLFAIAGGGMIFSNLVADKFDGKVSSDPTSSDLGKVRLGNQVIDPYGGFQQYAVAISRMMTLLSGNRYSSATGAFAPTPYSVAENFVANKLSPAASLAYEIARSRIDSKTGERENRFGQPMDVSREIKESFIPLFIQDMKELSEEDVSFQKMLGVGAVTFFGMGSQNYPERTETNRSTRASRPRISLSR
jgi:hypothetical protein